MHLASELSQNKWKLGFSDGNKMRFKTIVARNLEELQKEIEKAKQRFKLKGDVRILDKVVGRAKFNFNEGYN